MTTTEIHPLTQASDAQDASQFRLYEAARLFCLRYEAAPIVEPSAGFAAEHECEFARERLVAAIGASDQATERIRHEMAAAQPARV